MAINTNLRFLRQEALRNRILVLQGGTRSGKTYSALQYLIELCYKYRNAGMTITIAREKMTVLRGTAMVDFFDLLNTFGGYSEVNHMKSTNEYWICGNKIEFIGVDEGQKVRGRKRDILYLNEANETPYHTWMQLILRTKAFVIMDYNPSMDSHWIYDHVLTRDDHKLLLSSYLDNPHLTKEQVHEIERLRSVDQNYWQVYGLGERGISQEQVYTHWKEVPEFLDYSEWDYCYGMDFGFNSPTALVKIYFNGDNSIVEEVMYRSGLTSIDMVRELKVLVNPKKTIYGDSADSRAIDGIATGGFNIVRAKKDVLDGIRVVKQRNLYIAGASPNLRKEIKNYKWRLDRDGYRMDEPVGVNDHAMDAMRYGIYSQLKTKLRPARFRGLEE